ncbi:hypothetical protein HDU87_008615 [Geranomyces variabilis]|uniref:Histone chaperone RTT106/FACT complex subunit SPT16-like middle domain-containing protein n=1 Tax=Geranomyces variabilis TaxID=109894 RepID=A0AAD5XUK5_9FUNG|nr:hypothetical protein HDU87_008615 [Geranomyces variabilis]
MDSSSNPGSLAALAQKLPPDLRSEVLDHCSRQPTAKPVLTRLLAYFLDAGSPTSTAPDSKKRKVKEEDEGALVKDPHICTVQSLSFTMPARKRFWLRVHASSLRIVAAQTEEPVAKIKFEDIAHAFCLPTPDKVKKHFSICLLLKGDADTVLFGFEDAAHMLVAEPDRSLRPRGESGKSVMLDILSHLPCKIVEPDVRDFSFASNSFGTPVQYFPCHYKNKEGFMYLLPHGFFYGMKKPILFLPFAEIAAANLVQAVRTFTLRLASPQEDSTPFEFEHITADYMAKIMSYMQKHSRRFGTAAADDHRAVKHENGAGENMDVDEQVENGNDSDDSDVDFDPGNENTRDTRLAEEYDSGHDTDSNASSMADVQEHDEQEGEEHASDANNEEEDALEAHPRVVASLPKREISRAYVEGVVDEVLAVKSERPPTAPPRAGGMAAIAAQIERERKSREQPRGAKVKAER